MTEMRTATSAGYFCSAHAAGIVDVEFDAAWKGFSKTGPAAAGMVFRRGAEQRLSTANAPIDPGRIHVLILTGKRRLGALLACDVVLVRRQQPAPLRVALLDFVRYFRRLSEGPRIPRSARTRFSAPG